MSDFHFVMPTGSTSLAGGAIADFTESGTVSDVVSMAKYETAYFIVHWGVGTTGTATITAIPCNDADKSATTTAIPFEYKRVSAVETNTAWTASSSLATTAGSQQVYVIKVKAQDLPVVSGNVYEYVYLNIAELVNAALLGGCIIMMADPRFNEATLDAVTA